MGADLLCRLAAPLTERVRSGAHHYSRYSSFRGRERSLDPERLRRAVRHSWTNGASPLGLRRPSALGSDLRRRKILLAFRLHTAFPVKDRPKSFSVPVSLQIRHTQTPIACTLNADLLTDHRLSASLG